MKATASKTVYACSNCGSVFPRWQGQCPDCGSWDTLHEEAKVQRSSLKSRQKLREMPEATILSQVQSDRAGALATGLSEFDGVVGGGVVAGSSVLVGGEPGIGKSTLLLQVAGLMSRRGIPALYVSGEESAAQIKRRAERLDLRADLHVLAETDLASILTAAERCSSRVVVVDSIQTTSDPQWQSPPGTVSQVRECASAISDWAQKNDAVAFLVGHVTKDGFIAGPKVLEHLVDTVLQFEGDRRHWIRILRCVKNRFGPTHEVGLFEMTETGLVEIADPSAHFLSADLWGTRSPGTAVGVTIEGHRPLLLEVQALVGEGSGNMPQRVVSGVDPRRAAILIAVLQNLGGVALSGRDVYLNIAGGYSTDEPAIDLACAMAVASSARKRPAPERTIFIGELGLSGEIRGVPQLRRRLSEAEKIGFRHAVVPSINLRDESFDLKIAVDPVSRLDQVLAMV